jgi:hypothetical protein
MRLPLPTSKLKKNLFSLFLIFSIIGVYTWLNFKTEYSEKDFIKIQNYCQSVKTPKQQCWSDQIKTLISKKGIDASLEATAYLFENEPEFSQSCHSIVHEIGNAAYQQLVRGKALKVNEKTGYCGFGFHHGFMEALFLYSSDLEEAKKFCADIGEQLKDSAPDAELQCYHGIGHGTVGVHDPSFWGDEEAMINPALKLCEQVSTTDEQLYRCSSGVFNGIAVFYINHEYELEINQEDPLWLCHLQLDVYKEPCYGNMNVALMNLSGNDFVKAANYIVSTVKDIKYSGPALRYLSGVLALLNVEENDHQASIEQCRTLSKELYPFCIQGFVHGLLEHGIPNKEYEAALDFCRSQEFSSDEKEICFKYSLEGLHGWYPQDRAKEICLKVEPELRHYCQRENYQ